ncbi:MAG: hypothetical protein ACYS0D_04125, partial [Planctomycetota bacterium]
MAIRTAHRMADAISKQEILDALAAYEMHLTDADVERVGRYVRALRSGVAAGRNVVVVKGEAPVHGRDGRVVDLVAAAAMKVDERGNVSHYEHNVLGV